MLMSRVFHFQSVFISTGCYLSSVQPPEVYDPIFPSEHADSGHTFSAAAIAAMTQPAPRSDARFVEIDGEIHEVSGSMSILSKLTADYGIDYR